MTRPIRIAAIATLVSQIVIVGTGGAVRLTGSGLGCDSWPHCTPESFFPVPEQGIHGFIEYANRGMGAVVAAIAAWMLLLAWRHRAERRGVVALAAWVLGLSLLQALIGAVVVWLELLPSTVGLHFVISAALVGISAWLVWRVLVGSGAAWGGSAVQRVLALAACAALAVVVTLGILTTGSGPHAGDDAAARNGLDSELLQHLHAVPAYVLFALVLALALLGMGRGAHARWAIVLLGVLCVQIVVGIVQSNTGLPVGLVGIHLVLSVIAVAVCVWMVLGLRTGVADGAASQDADRVTARIGA